MYIYTSNTLAKKFEVRFCIPISINTVCTAVKFLPF